MNELIIGLIAGFLICRLIDLYYYEGLRINWRYLRGVFRI